MKIKKSILKKLVREVLEGGPGSGIKGHTTNRPESPEKSEPADVNQKMRNMGYEKPISKQEGLKALDLVSQLNHIAHNDIEDLDQFWQRDEVGHAIVDLLKLTGDEASKLKLMSRKEIYDELQKPEIKNRVKDALDAKNKVAEEKVKELKKEVFKTFPLLSNIEKNRGFQESILKAQKIEKQKDGDYAVTTPNYYEEDVKLSKDELEQLKSYINFKRLHYDQWNKQRKKDLEKRKQQSIKEDFEVAREKSKADKIREFLKKNNVEFSEKEYTSAADNKTPWIKFTLHKGYNLPIMQQLRSLSEGWNKPGGRHIGVSGLPLKKVNCPKCKGTGDMSATKSGISCDKCHGQGKLYIDPGTRQKDDIFEVDSTKTAWENLKNEATSDHCEKCYGEEYESGTGELKKYLGHDLCYRCFDKIVSGKANINDLEEMSTVAGVAGFNAPIGTSKKGIKHNFPIKEENDEVILKNFKKDIKTVSHEYLSELIDDYMEEYPHLESQFQKITGQKKSPTLWKLPKDPGDPKIKETLEDEYNEAREKFNTIDWNSVKDKNKLKGRWPFFLYDKKAVIWSGWENISKVKDYLNNLTENTEMKTFKRILNEIDLSTKDKTLTSFLTQVSQTGELGKQFGANYKPETFMDWLRAKVENYGLSVSEKYLNAMEKNIKDKSPMQAQAYVYNALLKGSGLGLVSESKKRNEE